MPERIEQRREFDDRLATKDELLASMDSLEALREIAKPFQSEINSPAHYNIGKIEVIDFIEDQNLGFRLGNAIKYITRCPYKGKKKEDLEKAIWYLQRELAKTP